MNRCDVLVVGAGIVGLAAARAILMRWPSLTLAVLEKEQDIASHQTGHNSGVIHSGIYYRPDTQKAKLCVEGALLMKDFCAEHDVAVEQTGKYVLATSPDQIPQLAELKRRGQANGVSDLQMLSKDSLRERQPHLSAIEAMFVPGTAITDFVQVAHALCRDLQLRGATLHKGVQFESLISASGGSVVQTSHGDWIAPVVLNCAGLHSDRVAIASRSPGLEGMQIVPIRGEYYKLGQSAACKINSLVYPVPDPSFPFLGVHLTPNLGGYVEAGPNAVLAFGREGYAWSAISLRDLKETLAFPGFRVMALQHWKQGLYECSRSLSKRLFLKSLQKMMPDLTMGDLQKGGAGVRAQLLHADGTMCDDFYFAQEPGILHVLNAPSPAATASLAIGKTIAERLADEVASFTDGKRIGI